MRAVVHRALRREANPAAYLVGGDDRAACMADDLPLGTVDSGPFATALSTGTLPMFTFITPDLCDDMHDCDVATGDSWLHQWLDVITSSRPYQAGGTAVFVVWDEPTPMPSLFIAPSVPAGTIDHAPVDHIALLRTTEEMLAASAAGCSTGAEHAFCARAVELGYEAVNAGPRGSRRSPRTAWCERGPKDQPMPSMVLVTLKLLSSLTVTSTHPTSSCGPHTPHLRRRSRPAREWPGYCSFGRSVGL